MRFPLRRIATEEEEEKGEKREKKIHIANYESRVALQKFFFLKTEKNQNRHALPFFRHEKTFRSATFFDNLNPRDMRFGSSTSSILRSVIQGKLALGNARAFVIVFFISCPSFFDNFYPLLPYF